MTESAGGVKYTLQMPLPAPAYCRFALYAIVSIAFLSATRSLRGDDGAASIAAGGIVMVREPRITMQKEVLRISESKVQVDYEFRNDTETDITTEVAFPVPAYSLDWDEHSLREQGFEDFVLMVEGAKVHFDCQVRAKLKGRDVSSTLKRYGIDIGTFGHFDEERHWAKDVRRLSASQRNALIHAGLLYPEDDQDEARWSVEKKYYWSQNFPAHSLIHISHQYTPALGSFNTAEPGLLEPQVENGVYARELDSFCIDPPLRKTLSAYAQRHDELVPYSYVDFILTTANTWKTPIEDFTLIVERPTHKDSQQTLVSFCWNGPVTKIDDTHFSAHATNLIPKKELRIGFFDVMHYGQP
jgi:hypothetical protein